MQLKDIVSLQKSYNQLLREKKLTKKALCDLCVPFRDAHGLTDGETLRLARNEMSLEEIAKIMKEE